MPTIRTHKTDELLVILLRESGASSHTKTYECSIDLDQEGDVIGLEVEAPHHMFGPQVLNGLEPIQLASSDAKTPEGRTLGSLAQGRPPLRGQAVPWVGYDKPHDMLYLCVSDLVKDRSYEISVPVDCCLFFDIQGGLQRIDIPLDQVRKGRAVYLK